MTTNLTNQNPKPQIEVNMIEEFLNLTDEDLNLINVMKVAILLHKG